MEGGGGDALSLLSIGGVRCVASVRGRLCRRHLFASFSRRAFCMFFFCFLCFFSRLFFSPSLLSLPVFCRAFCGCSVMSGFFLSGGFLGVVSVAFVFRSSLSGFLFCFFFFFFFNNATSGTRRSFSCLATPSTLFPRLAALSAIRRTRRASPAMHRPSRNSTSRG